MVKPAPSDRTDSENWDERKSTTLHLRDFKPSNIRNTMKKLLLFLIDGFEIVWYPVSHGFWLDCSLKTSSEP